MNLRDGVAALDNVGLNPRVACRLPVECIVDRAWYWIGRVPLEVGHKLMT